MELKPLFKTVKTGVRINHILNNVSYYDVLLIYFMIGVSLI